MPHERWSRATPCQHAGSAEEEHVVTVRPVRLPEDQQPLLDLDCSFTTDRVYQIVRAPLAFALEDRAADPPVRKEFPLTDDDFAAGRAWEQGAVAERAGLVVGFTGFTHQRWNRRTEIRHLYVAPWLRGQGLGRMLIEAVAAAAMAVGTRCLWVETSNFAYPAIQFYRRVGFELCGLDTSLYDPTGPAAAETALYFSRPLPTTDDGRR
jgi:ribosomal protein S18 acetylase RimI-like enzyme